MMKFKIVQSLA